MFYRRASAPVKAWRYQGNLRLAPDWIDRGLLIEGPDDAVRVMTPDGAMTLPEGDWLVDDGHALFVVEHNYFSLRYEKFAEAQTRAFDSRYFPSAT